jgi:hypothetical protein
LVERLGQQRGERDYLHLLKLAADTSQIEVEEALAQVLDATCPFSLEATRRALPPRRFEPVDLAQPEPDLSEYDLLLEAMQDDEEVLHACC